MIINELKGAKLKTIYFCRKHLEIIEVLQSSITRNFDYIKLPICKPTIVYLD